jgi:hypothetical protein
MAEEIKETAGKKYPSKVTVREVWVDYPTLDVGIRKVRIGVKYQDFPTIYFDVLEKDWTPELEDKITDEKVEEMLKRLGQIK